MITATHINYYHICKRKLWLFTKGIKMKPTSDQVLEGKLTGELSYSDRAAKYTELVLPGGKIADLLIDPYWN
jgi:CRISPR-associated exonuclease Cas4